VVLEVPLVTLSGGAAWVVAQGLLGCAGCAQVSWGVLLCIEFATYLHEALCV